MGRLCCKTPRRGSSINLDRMLFHGSVCGESRFQIAAQPETIFYGGRLRWAIQEFCNTIGQERLFAIREVNGSLGPDVSIVRRQLL